MRICFISDSYPTLPVFGGISAYTRTTAQGLVARGHEVHVLVGRVGEQTDFADGAVHVHVRAIRWLPVVAKWLPGLGESWGIWRALQQLHRQFRFDIVEFPNWEGIGLVSTLLKPIPSVVRLHTSTADGIRVTGRAPTVAERFTIWAERTSARCADTTVTHSCSHRENMRTACELNNIRVIPHGIPIPPLMRLPATQRQAILTVGPLNPRKGAAILLASIPIVLSQVPDAEFWIVGTDQNRQLETEFRKGHPHIAEKQVQFLGSLSHQQLAERYSTCALYVSAAVYESFGLTFVEAMAHGKSVVACNISAMPEIIRHGQTGLLVPPHDPQAFADAIVRLLKSPELRQRLGTEGRRVAQEQFSADCMAKNIEQLFLDTVRQVKG